MYESVVNLYQMSLTNRLMTPSVSDCTQQIASEKILETIGQMELIPTFTSFNDKYIFRTKYQLFPTVQTLYYQRTVHAMTSFCM